MFGSGYCWCCGGDGGDGSNCCDGDTADDLIRELQPALYAKGTDYNLKSLPEKATLKELEIKAVFVGDKKGHSTTKLIQKIGKLQSK